MTWLFPRSAVHKFASCDGCQLSLLDLEDELLAVAGVVQIANFMEASREVLPPPYDVTLVEGSITTAHDAERIKQIREETPVLITIGACATAGGIQALRNWKDVDDFNRYIYAHPDYIDALPDVDAGRRSRAGRLRAARVPDIEVPTARSVARLPPGKATEHPDVQCLRRMQAEGQSVCDGVSRQRRASAPSPRPVATPCVPPNDRGCFGCFGPMESPNTGTLADQLGSHGCIRPRTRGRFPELQRLV